MKLYEFLEARKPEILHACLSHLKESYPDQTDEERLDHIPAFIDELIGVLRRDVGKGTSESIAEIGTRRSRELESAIQHGKHRRAQGFDITRVIHDYGVVCDFVNGIAAKEGIVFDSREHQVMNVTLDTAIGNGIESFLSVGSEREHGVRVDALGVLAHEIRNAVQSATLATSLIRKGQVGVAGRTSDVLQRALHRISVLVQTALVEAQLRGKLPLRPDRVQLAEMFKEVIEDAVPERGVRIATEVEPDLYVEADPRLLLSAISNLVQNALKFTRDGETIALRGRENGEKVEIEVEDRCGGLPPNMTKKPFAGGSPDRRGVGFGLPIVRKAIEAHGGVVTLRDLPGVGCVFTISLPAASALGKAGKAA